MPVVAVPGPIIIGDTNLTMVPLVVVGADHQHPTNTPVTINPSGHLEIDYGTFDTSALVMTGGRVSLNPPVHGKATTIDHDGRTIFRGLSSPLTVGRYHSLIVDTELPGCLEESARGGGVLMGLRHRELPAEGVQFHPESVLTEEGQELLRNFLELDRGS